MNNTKTPINIHSSYHAHIYFNEDSKRLAKRLCDASSDRFKLKVGQFHEKLVGPHPCWSCQISFGADDFDRYLTWLDVHRQELTVLIHAVTGDDIKDHTEFVYWLGQGVELDVSVFEHL